MNADVRKIDGKLLKIVGDHDQGTIDQAIMVLEQPEVLEVNVCADGHLGYSVPIGGVVLTDKFISPSAVGFDIACGNMAVRTNLTYQEIAGDLEKIMQEIFSTISFGVGRTNAEEVDDPVFYSDLWWGLPESSKLKQLARAQLGTVGSGNHFVDLFRDTDDMIWVGVHFGSRGLGHKLAKFFIKEAGGKDGINTPPAMLALDTPTGQDYLVAMELAGKYAYAGREWVVNRVLEILQADGDYSVHNHHNFAWFENGKWVTRKGSTPLNPGQESFIGGSMGHYSVIVRGRDTEEARFLNRSTVHGAGRVMSRNQAAGRWRKIDGQRVRVGGEVSWEDLYEATKNVIVVGGGRDEAPQCYRPLSEVLSYHTDTLEILEVLFPIGVAMAGENTFDPYKD